MIRLSSKNTTYLWKTREKREKDILHRDRKKEAVKKNNVSLLEESV